MVLFAGCWIERFVKVVFRVTWRVKLLRVAHLCFVKEGVSV